MVAAHAITPTNANRAFRRVNPLSQMHTTLNPATHTHTSHSHTTWPLIQESFIPPSCFYTASANALTTVFRWISYTNLHVLGNWTQIGFHPPGVHMLVSLCQFLKVELSRSITAQPLSAFTFFFYDVFYKQIYFLLFCICVFLFFS